jgi:ATP-dependent DNA helicase RecG
MLNAKFFIHPIDFVGMQRIERDEYPVAAVREMILNALVHRNYMGSPSQIRLYDNNFSVWNDGGLPEGITEEDLKKAHRSKPRNPLIADVCFKAGYIDSWGRGTIKIIEACEEAGLPEPILQEEQGGFVSKVFKGKEEAWRKAERDHEKAKDPLTVFREKHSGITEELRKNYGRNAEEIIARIYSNISITMKELAADTGKSQSTIEKAIKKLREAGLLERIGSTKAGDWKVKL